MSYGVMACLVNTDDLLKLLDGSEKKRTGFLSAIFSKKSHRDFILEKFKDDFDELDEGIQEMMEDDDALGQYTLSRHVLDEFLNNKIENSSITMFTAMYLKYCANIWSQAPI